jgi:DNA-directed RNA polymerase specialized sigma24 family protein
MERNGEERPGARRPWTLTAQAFDGLLGALDPDRERAAAAYERLRERLIGLMRWWGAAQPEDIADEALDRVARKLETGVEIPDGSLGAYVRGVARMVFYEWTRRPRAEHIAIEVATTASGDDHTALTQLDGCLDRLAAEDRRLLLKYYGEGRAADVRKQLARELGLSPTALRIRVHRLRIRVESAMKHSSAPAHSLQGDGE